MKLKKITISCLAILLSVTTIMAAPYGSYIPSKYNGVDYANTLYEPLTTVPVELTNPKDIYIDSQNNLYILQSKNMLFIGKDNQVIQLIGETDLTDATGIYVDENYIYIADRGEKAVKIFDLQGTYITQLDKPSSNLFGSKSPYVPTKVAVNENGQIFVLSDGNTNGLIQMDFDGEFIGYFGSKKATTSFFQKLRETVLQDTALGSLIKTVPPSIANLDIDSQGVVYATGIGEDLTQNIRRLNVMGEDIFLESPLMEQTSSVIDVAATDDVIFMLNNTNGLISMSDKNGQAIGLWGSKTNATPIEGLFLNPVAIEIDTQRNVYVLDEALNTIQVFEPTTFMMDIFTALTLYRDGKYEASKIYWENIIKVNRSSVVANESLGLIVGKEEDYAQAITYFENAGDKEGYSNTLWQIRERFLIRYLGLILIGIFVLYGLSILYEKMVKSTKGYKALQEKVNQFKEKQLVSDWIYFKDILKKPNHLFYRMKTRHIVSIQGATLILIISLILIVTADYMYGYLFYEGYKENFNLAQAIMEYVLVFGLYIISNILITSILEGEGKVKDIYIGTIYALAPYSLFALPVALLSNVLTLNDLFVLQVLQGLMLMGIVILLIIVHIEIHNYRFMESVKVLLLTLVTMLIIFIVTTTLLSLFSQLIIFLVAILKEVMGRV